MDGQGFPARFIFFRPLRNYKYKPLRFVDQKKIIYLLRQPIPYFGR